MVFPDHPSVGPALAWAVRETLTSYGPNGWTCEGCPFATTGPCDDETLSHPYDLNRWGGWNGNTDASEAYYGCGLPNSKSAAESAVWGEYPKCTEDEWRAQARAEM